MGSLFKFATLAGAMLLWQACEVEEERVDAEAGLETPAAALPVKEPLPELTPDTLSVFGEILPRKGMFQALEALGVADSVSLQLINVLRYNVDLTGIRAGERIGVKFSPDSSYIESFFYQPNVVTLHKLHYEMDSNVYVYSEDKLETEVRHKYLTGSIESGSSLNDALLSLKIPENVTQTVNGILLCKISFRTDARAGDAFEVVMREEYYGDEVIDARVLYTSYRGKRAGFHEAFRYMEDDPKSTYNAHYTSEGEALIHTGLRYPVDRLHISSGYGMRRHPVTGRRTMHNGVDYAVPRGSPVYAVAKGKVVKSSYDRLNGNSVAIRHADKTISYYLHLSSRNVKRGQTVRSRQIIGRVGSTGRSTGPHLHFSFKNAGGRWINPLSKRMIATPKLTGDRLKRLNSQISDIKVVLAELKGEDPKATTSTQVASKPPSENSQKTDPL